MYEFRNSNRQGTRGEEMIKHRFDIEIRLGHGPELVHGICLADGFFVTIIVPDDFGGIGKTIYGFSSSALQPASNYPCDAGKRTKKSQLRKTKF